MKENLKRWELALLISMCVTLISGVWAVNTQRGLADKLIRLHVIADSDSDEAQAIKLEVRDRMLEAVTPALEDAASRDEAEEILQEWLPELERIARETLTEHGGAEEVSATLSAERYPTRQYEGFALPPGEYLSLKLTLGGGEGKNWWCVVFPPLCVTAAESTEFASAILTDEEMALIEGGDGYVLKFKLIEIWESLPFIRDR